MIDFKNKKWVVYGASGWPAYITPFAVAPARKFAKLYGISNEGVALWKGKNFDWLFNEEELTKFSKSILPQMLKKQWSYYNSWQVKAKEFDKIHFDLFNTEVSNLSDTELKKRIKEYYEIFVEQYSLNNFIEPLSFYFQNHLQKLLVETGVESKVAEKLGSVYGIPIKPNYIKQCIHEYKKAKNNNEIAILLEKFHYINNDYTGSRPFTKKDLEDLVTKNSHHGSPNKLNVELPKKALDLLNILQMIATIQDVRKAESLMWVTGAEKLIRELAVRKKIPVEELLFATWDEIVEEKVDQNELKKRQNSCVVHWQPHKTDVYAGEEADKITKDFRQSILGSTKDIKEFKGIPASSGKVRGRAVIVLNVSNFHKVKSGDILIAAMTRPEYLPVMQLASAFVTDEGGITSHASIVAREMKKPCVIATKIASKILKDGNLVEVDADKGIVRILEK